MDYWNKVPISIIFRIYIFEYQLKYILLWLFICYKSSENDEYINFSFFLKLHQCSIPRWMTTWKNRDGGLFNRVVKINLWQQIYWQIGIFFCFRIFYLYTSLYLREIQQPGGCKVAGVRVSSTGVHPHRRFENKVRVDWPMTRMQ